MRTELPEMWYIKVNAMSTPKEVRKWRGSGWYDKGYINYSGLWSGSRYSYTEITLEEFKTLVLGEKQQPTEPQYEIY